MKALPFLLMLVAAGMVAATPVEAQSSRPRERPGGKADKPAKVQEGQTIPATMVYTVEGERTLLSDLWEERPALLITCSLSCPVARRTSAEALRLAREFGDTIHVAFLYTIEAHPQGDPSPYRGEEWIHNDNLRDRILIPEPRNLEERLRRAGEFKERQHIDIPIYVDGLENQAWEHLGHAPNQAVLIDTRGKVAASRKWFSAESLREEIEDFLGRTQP